MASLIELLLSNSFIPYCFQLFVFLGLVGISLEFRKTLGMMPGAAFLAASLFSLNILYWGSFVNFHWTRNILLCFGIFQLVRRRTYLVSDKVSYLVLLSLSLWFAGLTINTMPFSWDEFFWTLFDQHISSFSKYWDTDSGILLSHIRYMPGSSLWHNFFGLRGNYQEATAYFALSMLFVAIIYWLIEQVHVSNRLFVGAAIFLSIGLFSFAEGWFSLYVDPFVGLFIGIAILSGTRYLQGSKSYLGIFILALSSGILFKETGVTAVLAFSPVVILAYFSKDRAHYQWKRLALGIAYCAALVVSWKYYQRLIGAPHPINLDLLTDYSPAQVQLRADVWSQFVTYVTTDYLMLATWVSSFLVIVTFGKGPKAHLTISFLLITISVFLALHLFAFLYLVGGGMPARERYMSGLLLATFMLALAEIGKNEVISGKHIAFVMAILIWMPICMLAVSGRNPSGLFMLFTPHPKQVPIAKAKIAEIRKAIPEKMKEICKSKPEKIWYIYQDSEGYEAMIARHLLTPCQVSVGSWSLGSRYYANDVWTANYTGEQFLAMAKDYPLLLIGRTDKQFVNNYGRHFSCLPAKGGLYRFDSQQQRYMPDRRIGLSCP